METSYVMQKYYPSQSGLFDDNEYQEPPSDPFLEIIAINARKNPQNGKKVLRPNLLRRGRRTWSHKASAKTIFV